MANTYVWDFPTLDVHNSAQNGHDDVIQTIHYTVVATSDSQTDADGNYLSASTYGTIGLDTPDTGDSSFIAFDSVTKDNCKTWVLAGLGKTEAEVEADLTAIINDLDAPATGDRKPSGW